MSAFVRGLKSGAHVGGQWVDSFAQTRDLRDTKEARDKAHEIAQARLRMDREKHDLSMRSAEDKRAFMNKWQSTINSALAPEPVDDYPEGLTTPRTSSSGGLSGGVFGTEGATPVPTSTPAGDTTFKTKEYVDGKYVTTNDSFRAYQDPAESAADWANLMGGKRYSEVRNAETLDDAIAAQSRSGYATDPEYGAKLKAIQPTNREQAEFLAARRAELLAAGTSPVLAELGARQAALETGWGRSAPNNNYFGIKGKGGDRSGAPQAAGLGQQPQSRPQAAGLGQRPREQQQPQSQRMDPNRLARAYQEGAMMLAANPEFAGELGPSLQAIQQLGLSRWMQSYEGDPMSLDAWRHYGAGAAKFGIIVSPDKGMSLQFNANTDQRQQEKHESEMSSAERKAQQEELALHRQIVTAMDTMLQDGEIDAQEVDFLRRSFGVEVTGRTRQATMNNPGSGKAQAVTKYEVRLPDGSTEWVSKEATAAEAAAFQAIADLDKPAKDPRNVSASEQEMISDAVYQTVESQCTALGGCTSEQRSTLTQELTQQIIAEHQARYRALSTGQPYQPASGGLGMAAIYDQVFGGL